MTRKEERERAAENAHLDIYEKSIDTFIKGAEWADESMIQKACEWLINWDAYRVCLEGHKEWFIEQFKKAMEE